MEGKRADINPSKLQRNVMITSYCRTAAATLAGIGAGILGLTGLSGFYFFAIVSALLSGVFYLRVGSRLEEWFPSLRCIVWDGVMDGLLPFVLCWTTAFGLVHVY